MFVVWTVELIQVYAMLGIVFGLAFVARGAGRIDPLARDETWGSRVLIFPGAAALWPLLLLRWIEAPRSSTHESGETSS